MNPLDKTDGPLGSGDLDTRMAGMSRRGAWVIGLWFGAFLAWACLAPISGGLVATGLVKVEANRRTVTHRDGGTVARVRVQEGQRVERGQVLLELEDVRVEASVDLLRSQWAGERLRLARLEAESLGAGSWQPDAALLSEFKDVKGLGGLAARERAAFQARQTALLAQIEGERKQAVDTRTEIEVRQRESVNARKAMELMREELALNETLEQAQFVNRARVMTLKRGVSEYESRLWANDAELAQARQRLGALEARERSLRDVFRQQASEEQRESQSRAVDIEQRLRASRDDQVRQTVVAPEAGRLLNLRVNTPGSALGPREPIVDLVPDDAPLVIEARVPLDVGSDLHPGVPAEVKIKSAQSRYDRLLPAEVRQVSADALSDNQGNTYLLVQLQVSAAALQAYQAPWQPGLAAEVYIKISERTPVGFLVEPIAGYFRRAFREH